MIQNAQHGKPDTLEFLNFFFWQGDLDIQDAPSDSEKCQGIVGNNSRLDVKDIKFHFTGHEIFNENNIFPTSDRLSINPTTERPTTTTSHSNSNPTPLTSEHPGPQQIGIQGIRRPDLSAFILLGYEK